MVLAAVKLRPKQLGTLQKIPGKYAEMADVIVRSQVVYRIIRLKT